jgi:heat shock protein HtpX
MNNQTEKFIMPVEARAQSLVIRGILAVLLTIGFYGLALAIAGALLYLVYAEVVFLERINVRVTLMALAAAGAILWAIAPRIERFTAPGALLLPQNHPRLFEIIRAIADRLGQEMPKEVYLVPDVNAFVGEAGGFMGIGRKRIMGIGLPLLQGLNIQQFSAVLAHEFGHFYGGDTSLGPWIYRTRTALIRTVASLENKSLIQAPFRWYGEMFIRTTEAISRRQEFVADAVAAHVAGSDPQIEALQSLPGMTKAFSTYWENEVIPVFNGGYRPPLASGFAQFTQVDRIQRAMENILQQEMEQGQTSQYDSHPAIKDRIQSLQTINGSRQNENTGPAVQLLENLPDAELSMLQVLYGQEKVAELKPLAWEAVGNSVYLKNWQGTAANYQEVLVDMKVQDLPDLRDLSGPLADMILNKSSQHPNQEQHRFWVDFVLVCALASSLVRSGWSIEALPGCSVILYQNGDQVKPFEIMQEFDSGAKSSAQWKAECQQYGIMDLNLAEKG